MVMINENLGITGYHPILTQTWQFPSSVKDPQMCECNFVYNFVVKNVTDDTYAPTIEVGGVACATLGHGLSGPVIGHEFFGNISKVLSSLMKFPSWNTRIIEIKPDEIIRDPSSGLICGYSPQ